MIRTTIALDDALFRTLKKQSAMVQKSLKDHINDLLCWALQHSKRSSAYKFHWKPVKGTKQPAVSIDDRDRLYDFLDKN